MKTRHLKIQCEGGLHLRVAAGIVQAVQRHHSTVHMRCRGCPHANACSIFELLKLGADRGTSLEVVAEGPDEEMTLEALSSLLNGGAEI